MELFGFQDSMQVLGWASVFWSIATLGLVFQICSILAQPKARLIALHLLGSSFPFWRHACVIEVYSMELFFWALCVLGLVIWINKSSNKGVWLLVFAHAIGLLIHIHFMLLFPALIFAFLIRKEFRFAWLLPYSIPVILFAYIVYGLKIKTLDQIFFDSIQGTMLQVELGELLKGVGMVTFLIGFLFPMGSLLLFWVILKGKWNWRGLIRKPLIQISLCLVITLVSFCVPYPSFGIYVFLMPVLMLMSIGVANLWLVYSPERRSAFYKVLIVLVLQGTFYTLVYGLADYFPASSVQNTLAAKGSWNYYVLPWAKGNATSVLESVKKGDAPVELEWNAVQARAWLKEDSVRH